MASFGRLIFETVIADFLKVIPEVPLEETWEWRSDIIRAFDGTEQRISLRDQPRRMVEYNILLEDDVARNREYNRLSQYLNGQVIAPYYQYHTLITQTSAVSATKIYFDRDKTDFRDNDYAIIFRSSTEESFLIPLTTIDADGGNTATPLTNEIKIKDIVAPAFDSYMKNPSGWSMKSVAGSMKFSLSALNTRSTFGRPSSTAVIDTFDSLDVLDRRPLARSAAEEQFNIDPTIFDNGVGVFNRTSALLHAIISGGRQFHIPRHTNIIEMDYWRDFVVSIRGMRESFLFPTWREDLYLAETPDAGDPSIIVEGAAYENIYFPHDTFKRFQFQNPDGDIEYRKATSVDPAVGGNTTITLDTPVTNDPAWDNGFTIGFLNKVRLATDQIKLTHHAAYTIVTISIRNTDQ